MTILLLGGTTEARRLAELLVAENLPVVTSLAGEVDGRRLPPGEVRVGGFGGPAGLAAYLRTQQVVAVVDATHPFAARMTANAASGCGATGVPLLRLQRPSWSRRPDAEAWHWVDSVAEARLVAESLGERVFLAIGRQSLPEFAGWTDRPVLARVVDPPDIDLPPSWQVLRARGPFTLADERALLREHAIDVLVTKDSGGPTDAKLDAAATLQLPVVVIRRPPLPAGVPVLVSVAGAAAWVRGHASRTPDRLG